MQQSKIPPDYIGVFGDQSEWAMILSNETELDKSFDCFRQLAWQPSQVRESGPGAPHSSSCHSTGIWATRQASIP